MVKLRKISRGFQITLPQDFRETHNLMIGDFIEVIEEKDRIILKAFNPEQSENPVDKMIRLLNTSSDNSKETHLMDEKTFLQTFKKPKKKSA